MSSKSFTSAILLCVAAFASAQGLAGSGGGLSPQARDILKMSQAGVDESILLAFVAADSLPFSLTSADIEALEAQGVSPKVVAEMLRRDSELKASPAFPAGAVTEDQLFRLSGGLILYGGRIYPIRPGLNPSIKSVLQMDPVANADILEFQHEETASRATFWGGLAFLIGGTLYGTIADNDGVLNERANGGIVMGAIGCSLISWVVSGITGHSARLSLYNGLAQYNRDLIAQGGGR